MTDHLGLPFPSSAIFEKIRNRFRKAVRDFAKDNRIPILRLASPDRTRWDDRKLDRVRPWAWILKGASSTFSTAGATHAYGPSRRS